MSVKRVRISVLGSTGSIGTQVLDVVRRLGPEAVEVVGLGAQSNGERLVEQAREFKPGLVCIGDESMRAGVKAALKSDGIRVCSGRSGFDELAT